MLGGGPYSYFRYEMHRAAEAAVAVYDEIVADFAGRFGRELPALESYRCEDAEWVFCMLGSFATKAKDAVDRLRAAGQPVLIGGSMGTASYVLAGTAEGESESLSSACHGAGRAMSRRKARRQYVGRQVVNQLADRGILIRSPSLRGVAEEAPLAYKDVDRVVDIADRAGLSRKVVRLEPVICVKG